MEQATLHKFWWLWFPLLIGGVQAILEIALPVNILKELHTERGPHELIEFFFVFAGFLVAVRILWEGFSAISKWLKAWVGLAAVCCFYVAGEEISWGQHFLLWSTPDYWVHINDQQETNLHNTSSWLDQKPRILLEVGVVTGGLIVPLLLRLRKNLLPAQFNIIYPPAILAVTAALALIVKILEDIDDTLPQVLFMERASEITELYLFYFVLLYLIVLRRRILQHQR